MLEPELVGVLEVLEVAGLAPEVVARLTRPPAYRRAQRRAGLPVSNDFPVIAVGSRTGTGSEPHET